MIGLKRAYEARNARDGQRILVERLWPRGVRKEALRLDAWMKDVAPSTALRKWFAHDPSKWKEFCDRYFAELDADRSAWQPLLAMARGGKVTLIYGARDTEHNAVVALRQYLQRKGARNTRGSSEQVR